MAFGSVRKRASGNYRADYANPTKGAKPLRIGAPHTFATKTAARAWLDQVHADIERGVWKSPARQEADRKEAERLAREAGRTFGDYAETWFHTRTVAKSTADGDRSRLDVHLLPQWGTTPIRSITTPQVREWIANTLNTVGPGARKKAFDLFKQVMRAAEEDDVIPKSPVKRNMLGTSKGQDLKPSQRHRSRALTPDELARLAREMPDHQGTMTLLMGITGLRLGEVRGLRVSDLDLDAGTLRVERSVGDDGRNRAESTPKTDAGTRTLQLSPNMVTVLREHVAGVMRGNDAPLFPSSRNPKNPVAKRTVELNMQRACQRAGIPHTSPHDLRHTAASFAGRVEGINPKDVQAMLGQSTPGMALRYMHTNEGVQQRIAESVAGDVLAAAGLASDAGEASVSELPKRSAV
jgi:integrase